MKRRGLIAKMAVATSMARMYWMGRISNRRAPRGGASMDTRPWRLWLIPATRDSCSFSTIMDVEAWKAGHWNAPSKALINMRT